MEIPSISVIRENVIQSLNLCNETGLIFEKNNFYKLEADLNILYINFSLRKRWDRVGESGLERYSSES